MEHETPQPHPEQPIKPAWPPAAPSREPAAEGGVRLGGRPKPDPEDEVVRLLEEAPARREPLQVQATPVSPPRIDRPAAHEPPAPAQGAAIPVIDDRPTGARSPDIETPDDVPFPCPTCKYDLRGRPGGARCPECGSKIPIRKRADLPPAGSLVNTGADESNPRLNLFNSWHGLSTWCAPSPVLISPLPYLLPIGVGIAACLAFCPAFRLSLLRAHAAMPDSVVRIYRSEYERLVRLERLQLVIAGATVLISVLATTGALFGHFGPIYQAALVAWWFVALAGLAAQVRLGDALSRGVVDQEVLPLEIPRRIISGIVITAAVGGVGALTLLALSVLGRYTNLVDGGGVDVIWALAGCCTLVALIGHGLCVWASLTHATMVANCVYESKLLRKLTPTKGRESGAAATTPDFVTRAPAGPRTAPPDAAGSHAPDHGPDDGEPSPEPTTKLHAFTPRDDSPIILLDEAPTSDTPVNPPMDRGGSTGQR
jgi:DNA-directed RNA polymerase subunit RPC12/RpoP